MNIKTTTYHPQNLTRAHFSNPFSNDTIRERVVESGSVDLKDNVDWLLKGKYVKAQVVDKERLLKVENDHPKN